MEHIQQKPTASIRLGKTIEAFHLKMYNPMEQYTDVEKNETDLYGLHEKILKILCQEEMSDYIYLRRKTR